MRVWGWSVRAQHPHSVGQQFGERGGGTICVPRLPPPVGEVVSGGEGVGVVRAQHPNPVGQQLGERGGDTIRFPGRLSG
ncbi:hypothetical protein OG594_46165 [Streptomyces sp. NBC_01214]|nr:hypothetical protein [Streptomyces sp. NBC_01214]MCX4808849.1 hypothetical protein [Streptomyces sp. NBC_01214]